MKYSLITVFGLLLLSTVTITAQTEQIEKVRPEIDYSELTSTSTNARKEEARWNSSGVVRNDFGRCNSLRPPTLNKAEKSLLALSEEDKIAYKNFLKQKETGLIRLLPREKYDSKYYAIRGGGYSFTCKKHEYGSIADLQFAEGNFSVGFGGVNFGFILKLGDVPIERVTKDYDGVKFMFDFTPPTKRNQAMDLSKGFKSGVTTNSFVYKSTLEAELNTTYVVRSVNYNNTDVLVAFRVVKKDADGSLTILWKRLKRFSATELN